MVNLNGRQQNPFQPEGGRDGQTPGEAEILKRTSIEIAGKFGAEFVPLFGSNYYRIKTILEEIRSRTNEDMFDIALFTWLETAYPEAE